MQRRTFHRALAAAVVWTAGLAGFSAAHAQNQWPTKSIRLIVPFAAGGSTDVVARYIAQGLSDRLGQSVVVDNRTGAGGNIGTDLVARAPADGYTIGLSTSGPLANNQFLYKNMTFDPAKDIEPVALVGEIPLVIATRKEEPAANLSEFIAQAKADKKGVSVGQPGNGTIGHLALEQLAALTEANLVAVPYRGDTPAMTDLLSGSVQAVSAPITAFIPNLSDGRLRGLAVTSADRYPGLPDIPTATEQGVDMVATVWFAVVGPKGMPSEVVQKLNAEINAIISSDEGRAKLQQYGLVVNAGSPDLLGQKITEDSRKWQQVISSANITLE